MIFALVGNQNCGKTTLFNALTGSNQHVGNFPGVTVDQKIGEIKYKKGNSVVDLPGIYSIRPYTTEEIVTRDFVINEKPDGIINIIDATNIERNMYLTLQLLELHIPTIVALNMMDEVRNNGGSINIKSMSQKLGVPVIPISAIKNEGISELAYKIDEIASKKVKPFVMDFCPHGPIHRCVHAVSHLIEDHAEDEGLSARFCATKLIEGDESFVTRLGLNDNEVEMLEHSVIEMEHETKLDRNAALAKMRYDFIESVCKDTVKKCQESIEHKRSVAIDKILTGRFTALPVFALIMFLVFFLSFNVFGKFFENILEYLIYALGDLIDKALKVYGLNPVVHSLLIDGVYYGVGTVLKFLPIIMVLFFFLSILEDTGYMARVAFFMDRALRKIGLSGRSFVPMLIGFGCSVPAIMATRTLASERDRKMTILLTPYMSCSAKIPIYAVFCAAFFENYATLVMMGLYFIGMGLSVVIALVFRRTIFKGNPIPFVMELPNYRLPSLKSVMMLMWEKAKEFVQKAFTVLFIAAIVIWFLQNFDTRLNIVSNAEDSLLAMIGRTIAPLFIPCGFGDWRCTTALISGFTAKEAVVSTFSVLLGVGTNGLEEALKVMFTPISAFSFLLFTLLYTPCVAAYTALKKELASTVKSVGVVVFQCVVAWIVSTLFYQICMLIM